MKVEGSETDKKGTSAASHFVLFDCSGSMRGDKLAVAKEAVKQYVNALSDGDDVTLILFGSKDTGTGVKTVLQKKRMDGPGKAEVASDVSMIGAEAATPMYGAIREFTKMMAGEEGRGANFLLLTDGQASDVNDPEMYTELFKGMPGHINRSYVMGIGLDYDEKLLMSVRNSSNGEYIHVATPAEVAGKFAEISQKAKHVLVQGPKLLIKPTKGMAIGAIFKAEPQIQEMTEQMKTNAAGEFEMFMPDLVEGEDQVYSMMVTLPPRPQGEYREAQVKFAGIEYPPFNLMVGRASSPAELREVDPQPRLLFTQTRERKIAQDALAGSKVAQEQVTQILKGYKDNPEKSKTVPLSHIQDLQKTMAISSSTKPVDEAERKQVTAKLTKRIDK